MPIKTANSGGDFEKAPEGMHVARCVRIVDCGTHLDEKWNKKKRVGWIHFELPSALMEPDDKGVRRPFMVGKRYTLSHNEKALLRIDLESWFGKQFNTAELDKAGGFDLEKLLGRPALLNLIHSEDGKYVNIKSVTPLVQGMECPSQVNPIFCFSIEEVGTEKFATLSEKMRAYIMEAEECQKKSVKKVSGSDVQSDEDIPF